ncbi:MAG TPA: response regulator, partial [Candidatus Baltobacteraceae bacterium]|nr:response regulator [Candidatus Baltobacteraceae bacterium]
MRQFEDASGKRILVVDDDRNLRKIIQTNLELAGYDVSTAPNGEEALKLLDSMQPDLVVLDVMMPLMDGYEVARRIRRHPSNTHVPIIMLTAKSEVEDKLAG